MATYEHNFPMPTRCCAKTARGKQCLRVSSYERNGKGLCETHYYAELRKDPKGLSKRNRKEAV